MNFVSPSISRVTELHVVHAKFDSQHICKTTACIQLPHSTRAAGKTPSSCSSVTCESLFKLVTPNYPLTCRPFLGALFFGVEGMSQPSRCYLLLGSEKLEHPQEKAGKKKIHMEELNNKQLQQKCLISCICEVS